VKKKNIINALTKGKYTWEQRIYERKWNLIGIRFTTKWCPHSCILRVSDSTLYSYLLCCI